MLHVNLEHQILSNFRDVVETINSNEDSLQSNQAKKVKDKREVSRRNGTTVERQKVGIKKKWNNKR